MIKNSEMLKLYKTNMDEAIKQQAIMKLKYDNLIKIRNKADKTNRTNKLNKVSVIQKLIDLKKKQKLNYLKQKEKRIKLIKQDWTKLEQFMLKLRKIN